MVKKTIFMIAALAGLCGTVHGQGTVAVKTNLLYGAGTLTPNLGAEVGLGRRTTLDLSVGYNPWNLHGSADDNRKLVHLLVEPELRYWLCERFNGHFFGAHALFAHYNVGGYDVPLLFERQYRYEGHAYGGGVSYGYHWMWSARFGVEFELGAGVAQMRYYKYDCPKCGRYAGTYNKTYFGPTKAGITLIFMIK